jgi:peptidoglycan/LPS O-acetylase OafA/YrhL
MNTSNSQRRYDLDWLRVLAIMAVFVFHSTRLFDTDDWSIKNPFTYPAMDIWKEFATTWGMPLILLISGASVFLALEKVSLWKYFKGLFARLLLPLILGMFTHITFQVYLENLDKGQFNGSFWSFYPHYFDGMYGFGGNFAWMGLHLWYLEILFIFSLVFLPLFAWLKKTASGKWMLDALGNLLAKPGGALLFALPAILLINSLDPDTWGNRDLGGWSILIYPFFFISGFVIISNEALQTRIKNMRRLSLGLGLILTPAYLFFEFQSLIPALAPLGGKPNNILLCLVSWSWLLLAVGFGMHYLNFNTPFLKYANEACLPFYILHQTVIVTLGYFVVRLAIPDWLKYAIVLFGSFMLVIGTYEYLIRRNNLLRFLFGMKLLPRRQAAPALDTQDYLAAQP